MNKYISVNTTIEFLCFVCAFIFLRRDKSPVWKSAITYLLLTFLTEETGLYFKNADNFNANVCVYNIFVLVEASFNSLMYFIILKNYIRCRPVIIGGLALIGGVYVYELINHGLFVYFNLTITGMSVIFVLYGFSYFYLLITSDNYVNLRAHPPFWWVTGTIMFYFGGIVTDLFFTIVKFEKNINFPIGYFIYLTLNIILYSSWAYSFLCKYQQRKSSYISS